MKLSIVIPAYNEEGLIEETLATLYAVLKERKVDHEIVVVNDNSKDNTLLLLQQLSKTIPTLVYYTNEGPNGFGYAVRYGLERFTGDCVAVMMADLSDSPEDLVKFYEKMLSENVDCVFGSRFIEGGVTYDYPKLKRIINRLANLTISVTMGIRYNDTTNAFKLYKKETIRGIQPLLSPHFNLTIELPLKAMVRGYSYTVVPNSWRNRTTGKSNFRIREMGSRYFFILLYCLIERFFSRKDFHKETQARHTQKMLYETKPGRK